jgi:hypothetical protein
MVLPDSDRVPRAPSYLGTTLMLQAFAYRTVTVYGASFQMLLLAVHIVVSCPATPTGKSHGFRLFPFRSPLLWESLLIYIPPGT